jgi:hypothetical protein
MEEDVREEGDFNSFPVATRVTSAQLPAAASPISILSQLQQAGEKLTLLERLKLDFNSFPVATR